MFLFRFLFHIIEWLLSTIHQLFLNLLIKIKCFRDLITSNRYLMTNRACYLPFWEFIFPIDLFFLNHYLVVWKNWMIVAKECIIDYFIENFALALHQYCTISWLNYFVYENRKFRNLRKLDNVFDLDIKKSNN